jgi:hypothetical protein
MTLNCEEATLLVLRKDYDTITWYQQLKLSQHLLICKYCYRFMQQNKLMQKKATKLFEAPENILDLELSEEAKQKMETELANEGLKK